MRTRRRALLHEFPVTLQSLAYPLQLVLGLVHGPLQIRSARLRLNDVALQRHKFIGQLLHLRIQGLGMRPMSHACQLTVDALQIEQPLLLLR